MSDRPTIYLIDGSGYIFRAFYAIRPLSTRDGLPTNAVLGFARMLGKLIKDERPHLLGIAFDAARKSFRHDIYTEYKATREEPPESLVPQFPLIRELVTAMDIPVLEVPGYEADDVLATLATQAVAAGHDVMLVTGDKDLMQLVSPHVRMFDPLKDKHYGREDVIERFGVPPERVADVLALAGDASDNIPGVPKVGEKSAAKLVASYGDVEAVLAGLAQAGRSLKAFEVSVLEHAAEARLSKRLAVLAHDAPVSLELDALCYNAPRPEKLGPFLRRVEAFGLLRELGFDTATTEAPAPAPDRDEDLEAAEAAERVAEAEGAAGGGGGFVPAWAGARLVLDAAARARLAADLAPIDRSAYRTILDCSDLADLVAAARAQGELSVDLETTSLDPNRADIVGISLAAPGLPAAYIPIAHRYLGAPRQVPRAQVLEVLRPLLSDPTVRKVGQNLKYDTIALWRAGIELGGAYDDSMIAAWVLDPSRPSYGLDALAREVLGHDTIRYADVCGNGKKQIGFDEVPVDAATRYSAEDADVALRLTHILGHELAQSGLGALYRELEMPLMPVLARMERTGVRVDAARLRELGVEFTARLAEIEARAHAIAGSPVNLASPKQLAELFFDKLGLKTGRKTKTGYSTDQDVLEALADEHELPRVVLEHRMLAKLKSTYVDMLGRMMNPETGRVHTSYNQTGTATGRLSSSDPNLQNIPVRSEDGRRIRAAFVSDPGWVLVSADYSQIELRVMAHLSGDERFIEAFARGEDIHQRTAQEIITAGGPVDAEARRRAKAINFGILYGLSEFGLSRQLGIGRMDAATYIAAYFGRYPRIREFLDRTIHEARERGFVTTLAGRRRYLPDLRSKNGNVRSQAERIAMNTPIQGSAADLIKMAMLRLAAALESKRLRARLLLQVHDELVVEAPEAERDEVVDLLRSEMTGVMKLSVPLEVDVGVGHDWAEAH